MLTGRHTRPGVPEMVTPAKANRTTNRKAFRVQSNQTSHHGLKVFTAGLLDSKRIASDSEIIVDNFGIKIELFTQTSIKQDINRCNQYERGYDLIL